MLGDKGFIQDIRETFPEEVMTLSFDFKEESGHRWYLEKKWSGGERRDPEQSSFPGSLLLGLCDRSEHVHNKQG